MPCSSCHSSLCSAKALRLFCEFIFPCFHMPLANRSFRFIAGVGLGLPATSFPLAVLCGLGAGALVGYLIYKGGNKTSLQVFLVISTCFLYLVAAGLFSKGVWNLEQNAWVRLAGEGVAEAGAGPGSYDIRKSVWHVNVSDEQYPCTQQC
jgi:high-affinity iron transporter